MFERKLQCKPEEKMPQNGTPCLYRSIAIEPRKPVRRARYDRSMPYTSSSKSARILVSFCCVYVFWGGTYLAMRYGVEVLPRFVLAAARYLIAGPIMLALSAMFKLNMWPSR